MLLLKVYNRRHEDYKAGGKVKGTSSFFVYNFPVSFSPFRKCCLNVCQLTNFENVLFLCWFSLVPSPFSSLSKVFVRTDSFVFFFNYPAGDLAFQVLFGPFSEEQRDIIMEVLTSMFCYKHSKVRLFNCYCWACITMDRPFSKMAAENSNKSKLKTYTSNRKNTFNLVTLQNFSISGVISAEKM